MVNYHPFFKLLILCRVVVVVVVGGGYRNMEMAVPGEERSGLPGTAKDLDTALVIMYFRHSDMGLVSLP